MLKRELLRQTRHARVRKKVTGDPERLRLCVNRSLQNIYAQIIDDTKGITLVSASTLDKEIKDAGKSGGNIEAAKTVGNLVAKRALENGIKSVVFDRAGYKFHGRIKALADAARESGLEF
jgi:large subunit ribosomal protein L18